MALTSLPNEVLLLILSQNEIEMSDLGNLMLTSKRFLNVIGGSNKLWKRKFVSRYLKLIL